MRPCTDDGTPRRIQQTSPILSRGNWRTSIVPRETHPCPYIMFHVKHYLRIISSFMRFLSLLIFWVFQIQIVYSQSVVRIEPPNWWVGFKDSSLQIMLYGNNIGHLQGNTESEGIHLVRTHRVENPNYLFLDL